MQFKSGLPETACGMGSLLASTLNLRDMLPALLSRLGAVSLLDAPCGDCNWISKIAPYLGTIHYIGVDNTETHLETARRNYPGADLRLGDIVSGPLPEADVVLCRDFLQHLPDEMVMASLRNLVRTGARWFLLTEHLPADNIPAGMKVVNGPSPRLGGFRRLHLRLPPVGLEAPVDLIADPPGSSRAIGVWPRSALLKALPG